MGLGLRFADGLRLDKTAHATGQVPCMIPWCIASLAGWDGRPHTVWVDLMRVRVRIMVRIESG